MKALVAFAAVLVLAGGSGAWARPVPHHRHLAVRRHAHAQPRHLMAAAHVTYAQPAKAAAPARRPVAFAGEPSGPPEKAGWFKTHDEAGWGFSRGGAKTVVGLYKRPEQPQDLPGPQIYHQPEGRGAAGLSISLKLH